MLTFCRTYWPWILGVASFNVAVWLAFERLHSRTLGYADLWPLRMYLWSGLLLLDNLGVLWWYADSTRRQTRVSEQQALLARDQLALSEKDYIERNKPIVYLDRDEDPERRGYAVYVIRNVGGGYAANVFYLDVTVTEPIALGSLGSGEHRVLPQPLFSGVQEGRAGLKCVLVSEGPYTRTTQWTATLNLRTQEPGAHAGQVLHRPALATLQPPRFEPQALSVYLTNNAKAFRLQLRALTEDGLAPRLLPVETTSNSSD